GRIRAIPVLDLTGDHDPVQRLLIRFRRSYLGVRRQRRQKATAEQRDFEGQSPIHAHFFVSPFPPVPNPRSVWLLLGRTLRTNLLRGNQNRIFLAKSGSTAIVTDEEYE